MSEPHSPGPPRSRRLLLAAALVVATLALDLGTKAWAWERLRDQPGIVLKKGVFVLDFAFNTGSAFGMLSGVAWARSFFIVVTVLAFAYLVRLLMTLPTNAWSSFAGIGLITGGALGNLHDRLVRIKSFKTYFSEIQFGELLGNANRVADAFGSTRHYVELDHHGVVDFIVVYYWPHKRWPAFNIADVALCVGVGLFMLYLHRYREEPEQTETTKAPDPSGAEA